MNYDSLYNPEWDEPEGEEFEEVEMRKENEVELQIEEYLMNKI